MRLHIRILKKLSNYQIWIKKLLDSNKKVIELLNY